MSFNSQLDEYLGNTDEIECPICGEIYDPQTSEDHVCPFCQSMLPDDGGFLYNHFQKGIYHKD